MPGRYLHPHGLSCTNGKESPTALKNTWLKKLRRKPRQPATFLPLTDCVMRVKLFKLKSCKAELKSCKAGIEEEGSSMPCGSQVSSEGDEATTTSPAVRKKKSGRKKKGSKGL
ncbi:hypothetical protein OIU79_001652 [Salix purpurea]|uniref:Uncharacterized protein n=1 Tax=Salix purpurea TaxID=77065 RepID=A0A9Q0ZH64_SALPP|nr:hypothetical protein OIU79_001652 [Salix purpurea]